MPSTVLNSTQVPTAREVLTADRTYYVNTAGSDSNDGLTGSTPFLTIQKALDTVSTLDLRTYDVTIQLADGTYTAGGIATNPWLGSGTVTIQGNSSTPANVVVSTTSADCFLSDLGAAITVKDMKLQTTTSGYSLYAYRQGSITYSNIDFGASATAHIRASDGAIITCSGNYTISGAATSHMQAVTGVVRCQGRTITFSGTPAITTFYNPVYDSVINMTSTTFVGNFTGTHYAVSTNSCLVLNATTLIGSIVGTCSLGGIVFDANSIDPRERLPDGIMWNGKISVSVASNNLTVALKTNAGNDPTQTSPVYVMINGTLRTVTSALSVTKNAGTNWFNSGSSELATKEVDYFVYLLWNTGPATDIVDIGFARVPYYNVYSEVNTTTTNEKYFAYGNATPPASTDDMVVIGRIPAILSAGAGYTWSLPTLNTANLIQRPIYQTRVLAYTPTWTNITVGNGTNTGNYLVDGRKLRVSVVFTFGSTSSVAGNSTFTHPISINPMATLFAACRIVDVGTTNFIGILAPGAASSSVSVMNASGTYVGQTILSSTVPMTWAAGDQIMTDYEHWM